MSEKFASPWFGLPNPTLQLLTEGTITSVPGVEAAVMEGGIRDGGGPDLVILDMGSVGAAAGVFTSNKATAAPVILSRSHLENGRARAVVANAGCANACTGRRGLDDASAMASAAASAIGAEAGDVLVASTGLIGFNLPISSMVDAISKCETSPGTTAGHQSAAAIMTTDTHPKEAAVLANLGGQEITIGAIAKGAAMLAPSMATMLAFVATDASIDHLPLKVALDSAVSRTFNRISVDACQSTNDTVLVLANGSGEPAAIESVEDPRFADFESALTEVCAQLAFAMVSDGEGSTRIARVSIEGAASDGEALIAAKSICSSVLVRCSLYGSDPYWGRLASEIGSSGARFDPDRLAVEFGGVRVADAGVSISHDQAAVAAHMRQSQVEIVCSMNMGSGSATMITCDLGPGYIEENMGTS